MSRSGYSERRAYVVPTSLSDLVGPTHGIVSLPDRLRWTGRTAYNLDNAADRAVFYERVLVEASTVDELTALLDSGILASVWRRLFLPAPARRVWEQHFTDLAAVA